MLSPGDGLRLVDVSSHRYEVTLIVKPGERERYFGLSALSLLVTSAEAKMFPPPRVPLSW